MQLTDLVEQFKRNVEIKDRRYRLSVYKKTFVGSEAVQWLVTSGIADNRTDAVGLGQLLLDSGYIEHCLREHDFKDDTLYYRFIADTDRGAVAKSGDRKVSWADFLAPTKGTKESMQPKLPTPDFESVPTNAVHIASSVWPLDEYNIALLDNVHPPEWIDPGYEGVYNLVVIGAGAGGLVTASGAAGVGAKVALIEANVLGGDCLNVGCVPSKALIHAANLAHTVKNKKFLAESGISVEGDVKVDFAKTMSRLRSIRAQISDNDSATRYTKKLGVDVYFGYAKFTSENSVTVNGKTLKFKRAVIATGGYPSLPSIPGIQEMYERSENVKEQSPRPLVMTNETFFNMTVQPKRLGVIGTGVIGMEMAQAMQRLGTRVTVLGRSGGVLPKEDKDLAELVKEQMVADGVAFRLDVKQYVRVSLTGSVSENGIPELALETSEENEDRTYKFDALLVAAGRKPNVTGMDLEKAGVEYDVKVGLKVSDGLQTTNPKIFGVGDCCSAFKFTHAADFMARMVIRNALFLGREKMSNLLIPYATFTTPEISHVGLYEADFKSRGIAYNTFEKHFSDNDRAICDGATVGMVRVHVDPKSDQILGASIVGEGAGNMISELTLAMQSGTGLTKLASVIHPYPTTAEAVRQVGDIYNRTRLTGTVRALLRGLIKVQR